MVCTSTTERISNHHIVIDGLKNGETLTYSLLICKGHIEEPKDLKCPRLPHILITTNSKNLDRATINSTSKTFKFLINLDIGSNLLRLSYCCMSLEIKLDYVPRNTDLKVVPLYIICEGHTGHFQAPETETNTPASACKRITTGCKLLQGLFAEKLHEAGLGRKTFELESTGCAVFHSKLRFEQALSMGQLELWYYFAREIMSSEIGNCHKKYLAFLSCTTYDGRKYSKDITEHSEIISLTKAYVAFGGEGLALLGTACLYTWPESVLEVGNRFQDCSPVDRTKFMDDSCFRGTLGGCFSTSLGAALHELCHTFDLGHTEDGIMGRGFDNIQNVFLPNRDESNNRCDKKTDNTMANFNIFHKRRKTDDTYWMGNCLLLLNYHKWFNVSHSKRKCTLHYDGNTRIVKSTAGLRVIEIRRESDEMVLKYWLFEDKVLKYSHQIGDEINNGETKVLVIEDNDGNILKRICSRHY